MKVYFHLYRTYFLLVPGVIKKCIQNKLIPSHCLLHNQLINQMGMTLRLGKLPRSLGRKYLRSHTPRVSTLYLPCNILCVN